ncbi:hypothetical protein [Bradyrhizobium sp. RDI18]|uniref:hypothetical protein n=1 Tax=Bradyrhizobium sp. RDI18 TaxID=3367400 RepID=UPI00371F214A
MSKMELSVFRRHSLEAIKQKARRVSSSVAVGYVKSGPDRIEKDPDRRVQEAIALVFRKFNELHMITGRVWCGSGRKTFHFPY